MRSGRQEFNNFDEMRRYIASGVFCATKFRILISFEKITYRIVFACKYNYKSYSLKIYNKKSMDRFGANTLIEVRTLKDVCDTVIRETEKRLEFFKNR